VDVAIPANDDSIRAIDLILNELADAVAIGKTMVSARPEPKQRPRRIRSKKPGLVRADKAETETVIAAEQTPTKGETPATAKPVQKVEIEQQEPEQSTP
jgi:ribosomal protein S2